MLLGHGCGYDPLVDIDDLELNTLLPNYRISYLDIFKVVELTCEKHQEEFVATPSLEEIIHYDLWARGYAASIQQSSGLSPVLA